MSLLGRISGSRPIVSLLQQNGREDGSYGSLYFINLREGDADGVEHWFDFIDVIDPM